jgi:hypothetical protein
VYALSLDGRIDLNHVAALLRASLKQHISKEKYQRLKHLRRMSIWYSRKYLPRVIASHLLRHTPIVHTFSSNRRSCLAEQIRRVNVLRPTRVCRILTRNGSDKGDHERHNYTTIYSAIFSRVRKHRLKLFELGIGTTNPGIASNMGSNGKPGASLRGWREVFPNALIYGADIDGEILFEENRIETFYCDQCDREIIRGLWRQPALRDGMDIIIDDGLHTFESNTTFLEESLRVLLPNGVYVIEDIPDEAVDQWKRQIDSLYSYLLVNHEFVLVKVPSSSNRSDNNLLLIRRCG